MQTKILSSLSFRLYFFLYFCAIRVIALKHNNEDSNYNLDTIGTSKPMLPQGQADSGSACRNSDGRCDSYNLFYSKFAATNR